LTFGHRAPLESSLGHLSVRHSALREIGIASGSIRRHPILLPLRLFHDTTSCGHIGRFLIRLSDPLFLAPQSDLVKKQNTARKSSARNAQIRGLFASTPKAEVFLADTRTPEWPAWPQNQSFGANQAYTLCLWKPSVY
jgi:hypothetical protein